MRSAICAACLAFAVGGVQAQQLTQPRTEVICSYAPSQDAAVNRISGMVSGAGIATEAILAASGLAVVTHVGGASILTGAGGYVAGTMVGAVVATTIVTASVIVGGTAITVELACAPKNHPELVQRVIRNARKYSTLSDEQLEAITGFKVRSQQSLERTRDYWFEKVSRVRDWLWQ